VSGLTIDWTIGFACHALAKAVMLKGAVDFDAMPMKNWVKD
jgi:hypothetical protein